MKWTNDRIFTLDMQSDPELKNITTIGDGALAFKRLKNIIIPEKVTSIGKQAFAYTPLESINFPDGITSIGEDAFSFNHLTSITIPSKVTSISKKAFFSNQLTNIEIPSNVKNIGKDAFSSNDNLSSVTIHATNPPTTDTPFPKNNNLKIYVPENSVNKYKTTEGWKEYADKIEAIK